MAGSLNEIKNKIASTKKTSQITGAMHMVSAAKLAKSEQAAKSFEIYARKVRQVTTDLLRSELMNDGATNPMLIRREVKKTGYIVITSDSGLKGAYNSTILKAVMGMIDQDHDSKDKYEIIAIGGMGADFFRNRGMPPSLNCEVFLIILVLMRFKRLFQNPLKCIKMRFSTNSMSVITTISTV